MPDSFSFVQAACSRMRVHQWLSRSPQEVQSSRRKADNRAQNPEVERKVIRERPRNDIEVERNRALESITGAWRKDKTMKEIHTCKEIKGSSRYSRDHQRNLPCILTAEEDQGQSVPCRRPINFGWPWDRDVKQGRGRADTGRDKRQDEEVRDQVGI